MKKHSIFILLFALTVLVYFYEVIFMRASFLGGDYIDQFYPWSFIYANAVKHMHLPYWTRYFQCGFPLMAEGQIGGYYPLNLLFFYLLPFNFAYNYIIVLHFCIAGIFTYIFSRRMGACQRGGYIAALIFCFGSAYAGCAINTAAVKVLAWFPAILLLFEEYFDRRRSVLLIISGLIFGAQLLAGSTQIALYCSIFYLFYFLYGLYVRERITISGVMPIFAFFLTAFIIFLPQFILSSKIAELSWRKHATLGFALWGSFNPLSLLSTVFPFPVYSGVKFYIGVFSIPFFFTGIMKAWRNNRLRPLLSVLLLSLFLALGKYNPLYTVIIRFFRLYDLRNPSKFILFGLFASSVLSGIGFTAFFDRRKEKYPRKPLLFSFIWVALAAIFFAAGRAVLCFFKDDIIRFGKFFVKHYVYGKGFHRYDLSVYYSKVSDIYESFVKSSSPRAPFIMASLIFAVILVILIVLALRKEQISRRWNNIAKNGFLLLIFAELFVFSSYGTGFRGNIFHYGKLRPDHSSMLTTLRKDKTLFRILPYGIASGELPDWALPSANALYGLDNVALYTPLANEKFRKALKPLEVINSALGLKVPAGAGALDEKINTIRLLNVGYIISSMKLDRAYLVPLMEENGVFLYRLKDALPRVFFTGALDEKNMRVNADAVVTEYTSGIMRCDINAPYDGYLVFSENNYPGWKVIVDGKEGKIIPVLLVQAVEVKKGEHNISFVYEPFKLK